MKMIVLRISFNILPNNLKVLLFLSKFELWRVAFLMEKTNV